MRDLLWRDLAPLVRVSDGRRLVAAADLTHEDYVERAFDQIRSSGASQPAMVAALLMVLGGLVRDLERDGLAARAAPLRRQAALLLAGFDTSEPLPEELERARQLAGKYGFESPA